MSHLCVPGGQSQSLRSHRRHSSRAIMNRQNTTRQFTKIATEPDTRFSLGGVTRAQESEPPAGRRRAGRALLGVVCSALLVVGCAGQVIKRGTQFRERDIQQIQVGMGQEQVRLALGSPSTTTTIDDGSVYYYISSTETQTAFFKPKEVSRQVVAVYFAPVVGTVTRVARYGLKDGKIFDFVSRSTPAPGGKEDGLLKSLFRNLGSKQVFGE